MERRSHHIDGCVDVHPVQSLLGSVCPESGRQARFGDLDDGSLHRSGKLRRGGDRGQPGAYSRVWLVFGALATRGFLYGCSISGRDAGRTVLSGVELPHRRGTRQIGRGPRGHERILRNPGIYRGRHPVDDRRADASLGRDAVHDAGRLRRGGSGIQPRSNPGAGRPVPAKCATSTDACCPSCLWASPCS